MNPLSRKACVLQQAPAAWRSNGVYPWCAMVTPDPSWTLTTQQSLPTASSWPAPARTACPCCVMARAATGMARSRATRCAWSCCCCNAVDGLAPRKHLVKTFAFVHGGSAQGAVWSCVLNQPALLCATGSADFTARVWDACSGTQLHEFAHPHIVRCTSFSHDTNKLATGGEEMGMRMRM